MKPSATSTYDGTRAQVAAFFEVDLWTVNQWINHPKPNGPRLFPSRLGNAQRIDEDQIAKLWARRYGKALGPGKAEILGREKWQAFLSSNVQGPNAKVGDAEMVEMRSQLARLADEVSSLKFQVSSLQHKEAA
jgi:hypothetical protein